MLRRFPATASYLLAIVAIHLAVTVTGGSESFPNLIRWGALAAPRVQAGEYWRLITPIFLHGGFLHLAFNSFALYQLGPLCEHLFGSARFAFLFLLCGIGGSLLSITVNADAVSVGASGAIFGLAGLLLATSLKKPVQLSSLFRRSILQSMLPFVGYNLFIGFTLPGIDNFGHIGGLLAGGLLGFLLLPGERAAPIRFIYLLCTLLTLGWAGASQWTAAQPMVPQAIAADVEYFLDLHRRMNQFVHDLDGMNIYRPTTDQLTPLIAQMRALRQDTVTHFQLPELTAERATILATLDAMHEHLKTLAHAARHGTPIAPAQVTALLETLQDFETWSQRMIAWSSHYGYVLRKVEQD